MSLDSPNRLGIPVYHAGGTPNTLVRFGVFTRLTYPPKIPRLQNSGVPGEHKGYVWFVWGYMGISMGISEFPHPTPPRVEALPGSQIRGREDREFLLQAIWDSMGGVQKNHGSRWLVGVHHKDLVTWENRAPKDWQVASPLVMQGFSNFLGLFQVIMANPVNFRWFHVFFSPRKIGEDEPILTTVIFFNLVEITK